MDDLVEYLQRSTALTRGELLRVVGDVIAYLNHETPAQFVQRRHRQLQQVGTSNETIFAQVAQELRGRPFAAPPLTLRQIRRLIYG